MNDLVRTLRALDQRLEQTNAGEVPAIYLPWTQRILNPFLLASSGNVWGDVGQPWPLTIATLSCSVYVAGANDGSNYWTMTLVNTAAATLATFNTSAISGVTWTRFSVQSGSITQPAGTNINMAMIATATGSPGDIYIIPAIAVLRSG